MRSEYSIQISPTSPRRPNSMINLMLRRSESTHRRNGDQMLRGFRGCATGMLIPTHLTEYLPPVERRVLDIGHSRDTLSRNSNKKDREKDVSRMSASRFRNSSNVTSSALKNHCRSDRAMGVMMRGVQLYTKVISCINMIDQLVHGLLFM